jgi:hypothetical protein
VDHERRGTLMKPFKARILLAVFTVTAGLTALGAGARRAEAYPQFQFSSGTQRCAQCHYSPVGFGLLTSWGRDESADTISAYGGDGGFLNSKVTLPASLALGGDVRYAGIDNDVGGQGAPELATFPMQAELYARYALGETGLSIYAAAGIRGATRDVNGSVWSHVTSFISREHYIMWKKSATGYYARVGRFYAPYGLRLAEHVYFVRRYSGFNLYEETYNASGGYLAENWELHVTAFTSLPNSAPDFLGSVGMLPNGAAVYYERRFSTVGLLGGQARVAVNSEQRLTQGGLVGKVWVDGAHMLAMGELDFQRRDLSKGNIGYNQSISYASMNFFPVKGLMAALVWERYQEDLRTISTARTAFDLEINLFPIAHVEVMFFGRYQYSGAGGADGDVGSLGMLQLHYYL